MEDILHGKIEQYIQDNISGIKYSMNARNARDFSVEGAPLLSEGDESFIIFKVAITSGRSAAIGNTTKRSVGVIEASIHLDKDKSDREQYKILGTLTPYLERKNFNGISLRDSNLSGEYESGKWVIFSWTFNFVTTQNLT